MPKSSPYQPSFSSGEFSPRFFGRTDNERYSTGTATLINYLPTTQGPAIRRPGFKRVAPAKDPSKPPAFIPFQFNQTQNYVLEFGDRYFRVFTNEAQVVTTGSSWVVTGSVNYERLPYISTAGLFWFPFYTNRSNPGAESKERVVTASAVVSGSVYEVPTPYSYTDVADIKWAQKGDTLYLFHKNYPVHKLQRRGHTNWNLARVLPKDGPYLPINSYLNPGDAGNVSLTVNSLYELGGAEIQTRPVMRVATMAANSTGEVRCTTQDLHGRESGDAVVIYGASGVVGVNTLSTFHSSSPEAWYLSVIDTSTFDLVGSRFQGSYVNSSAQAQPAIFLPYSRGEQIGRQIGLVQNGVRHWGFLTGSSTLALNAASQTVKFVSSSVINSGTVGFFYLGRHFGSSYPSAGCFHQDRLFMVGAPNSPQHLDASVIGDYENFQATGTSFTVADSNALNFDLASDQLNKINWIKSEKTLLAGSVSAEWSIGANSQNPALTPTNFNAQQTSFFGSHDADAVQTGNATLYIQKGQRKVRELNYFFQVDTYRSTDLAELSEHITGTSLVKICAQREPIPIVWGLRSDGVLTSMVYSRDDVSLKVGWARHFLGGQGDSGGSLPEVKTMAVIPNASGTSEQLWVATKRFINGTSVLDIEVSQPVFDDTVSLDDAFFVDCGGTYDNPIAISGITRAGSSVVTTAAAHSLSDGDHVKISKVIGVNSSYTNVDGLIFNSNLVNGKVFRVASTTAQSFFLTDVNNGSSYIDSRAYSAYVSGGEVRKLVSTISGLTWLKNETVSVLADGGVHPTATVNSAGVMALQYPAAKVQVGYAYASDLKTLRLDAGSADGSAIGKLRRPSRVAVQLYNVGELSIGPSFSKLMPLTLLTADQNQFDTATGLFSGIHREEIESSYDFDGQVCLRQSAPLPGMIQSVTVMLETNDV